LQRHPKIGARIFFRRRIAALVLYMGENTSIGMGVEAITRALWSAGLADGVSGFELWHQSPSSFAAARYACKTLPPPRASQFVRIQPAGTLGAYEPPPNGRVRHRIPLRGRLCGGQAMAQPASLLLLSSCDSLL